MVEQFVKKSQINTGLCHLFLPHTSASLILCENTDPDVRQDLEAFTQNWTPDDNPLFSHQLEGPDDMPAHIRTVYTHCDLTIPVQNKSLALGTWQGIFLWEHRTSPHQRKLIMTFFS